MRRHVGLDLGGTNVKWVVLDAGVDGEVAMVDRGSRPTHAEGGPYVVTRTLVEIGRDAIAVHGPVDGVGIGVPGLFDPTAGTIELFPNLPGPWTGHPLRSEIRDVLARPITLINDARAFTLAEGTVGAGAGASVMIGLVLGTGVGGGLLLDGRLHLGAWGSAGEVGHQTIDPDGPRCGCGNHGCVEVLAQASRLAELAGRATAEETVRYARDGDERSLAALAEVGRVLGLALANVVTVLGPDRIVIGGGVATAGDLLLDQVRATVRARAPLAPTGQIPIVAAALGPWAGAIGAALAARAGAVPD